MEFRILGPLEVIADGREVAISSPQQRALLALLVVNANRVMAPDRIVDDVWEGRLPATGTKALAFHVADRRTGGLMDRDVRRAQRHDAGRSRQPEQPRHRQ